MAESDHGTVTKAALTLGIVVLAIPGLFIEPGPISEAVAITAIFGLWGLDGGDN